MWITFHTHSRSLGTLSFVTVLFFLLNRKPSRERMWITRNGRVRWRSISSLTINVKIMWISDLLLLREREFGTYSFNWRDRTEVEYAARCFNFNQEKSKIQIKTSITFVMITLKCKHIESPCIHGNCWWIESIRCFGLGRRKGYNNQFNNLRKVLTGLINLCLIHYWAGDDSTRSLHNEPNEETHKKMNK